ANWVIQTILPLLHEKSIPIQSLPIQKEAIISLLHEIHHGNLTLQQAREIWNECLTDNSKNIERLITSKKENSPIFNYQEILDEVFTAHPDEAKEFKGGKKRLMGFFIGEIKKKYPEINIQEVQKLL
ncbi:MAG: GatB/YqeY domain-containing protein, partial [Saprospiraceae bacterium]